MSYIMRNNNKYAAGGGGGNTNSIELTMDEYEALESAGKIVQDTTYYITDEDIGNVAKTIRYDNTNSSIVASTVQGAIDELQTRLSSVLNVRVENGYLYFSDSMVRYIEDEEMITFDS